MQNKENYSTLLGLDWIEAERRLQNAGADVCVSRLCGKKGAVEAADSERVIRIRQEIGDGGKTTIQVLLASFRSSLD